MTDNDPGTELYKGYEIICWGLGAWSARSGGVNWFSGGGSAEVKAAIDKALGEK